MTQAILFIPDSAGDIAAFGRDAAALARFKRGELADQISTATAALALTASRHRPSTRLHRSVDDQILVAELGTWLPRPAEPGRDGRWLLEQYTAHGAQELARRVQGFFALMIIDQRTRQTHVITDRCGSLHVFVQKAAGGYLVSTSSAVLGGLGKRELDPVGLHEFIATGIIYEDRTLWADVKKIPPATVLTFSDGHAQAVRYWSFAEVAAESLGLDAAVDATHDALVAVLKALPETSRPLVSDLTGGYDSRFLLAGLRASGRSFETTVSGPADSPDVLVAAQIARDLGLRHGHVPPNPAPSAETFEAALRMTDGEYDAFDYARILHTHQGLSARYGMSLNGSFGELARGYWWELLWPRLGRREPLDVGMIARKRFAAIPYDASVFSAQAQLDLRTHMTDVAARALATLEGLPSTTQMDCVYYTLRMQRWQGRIASSTNQLWPAFSPIGFAQVLDPILAARADTRFRSLLVRRLFARFTPALARIPLEHGYPPAPATPFNIWRYSPLLGHYGGKVWHKLARRLPLGTKTPVLSAPAVGTRPEVLPLMDECGLAAALAAPALERTGLFAPAVLRRFLDPGQTLGGARLEQWRRLVTVETLLRRV